MKIQFFFFFREGGHREFNLMLCLVLNTSYRMEREKWMEQQPIPGAHLSRVKRVASVQALPKLYQYTGGAYRKCWIMSFAKKTLATVFEFILLRAVFPLLAEC